MKGVDFLMLIKTVNYSQEVDFNKYSALLRTKASDLFNYILSQRNFYTEDYKRLRSIQKIINNKYQTNIDIIKVCENIFNNIYLDNSGVNLRTYYEDGVNIEIIYKIIRNGNLECKGVSIIEDMIVYVLNLLGLVGE